MWKDSLPKSGRYFETENGILFHADSIEFMKQVSSFADVVVTDPPYIINYYTNYRKDKNHLFTSPIQNDNDEEIIKQAVPLIYNVLKPDSPLYMFGSWKTIDLFKPLIEKYFSLKNIIIWAKNNWTAGDLESQYAQQYEIIYYANKGKSPLKKKRYPDVWRFSRVTGHRQVHQNQKPVGIIDFILENSSEKGDIVFDPFLGSGTTAVSCERTGRRWVGVEIEEHYCEMIVNGIRNYQPRLL